MLINNTFVQLPDEYMDYEKGATGAFSESEFINNLMLNPTKYREFKRNINRINNIDNEINYIKSQEQKNQIDFVNNIKITEEEYKNAVETAKQCMYPDFLSLDAGYVGDVYHKWGKIISPMGKRKLSSSKTF